jgi:hypothetical protein
VHEGQNGFRTGRLAIGLVQLSFLFNCFFRKFAATSCHRKTPHYFICYYPTNNNMGDAQNFELGTALYPLNIGS